MPDYGKKTVVELQEILKSRSLPHTGKKAELVSRLTEADKTTETTSTEETAPDPATAPPEKTSTAEAPVVTDAASKVAPTTKASQDDVVKAAKTNETPEAPPPIANKAEREESVATDTQLAKATDYSLDLEPSSYEAEAKRRLARAERFGIQPKEEDPEEKKMAERAKRFGTEGDANTGLGMLDQALPTEPDRKRKRAREGEGATTNSGFRNGRGGKRPFGRGGRGNDRRGERLAGVQKAAGKSFSSDQDRLDAEKRKKRFAATA